MLSTSILVRAESWVFVRTHVQEWLGRHSGLPWIGGLG
jgi:hypothetical protein